MAAAMRSERLQFLHTVTLVTMDVSILENAVIMRMDVRETAVIAWVVIAVRS